jgi:hypothetical protein
MWEEPFSFWRNAGMGGYPGLRYVKIYLFSYRCITNGVGGPIAAKLCADVTVTWIRTEKLLGGVISLAQGFCESRHFMLLALGRVDDSELHIAARRCLFVFLRDGGP